MSVHQKLYDLIRACNTQIKGFEQRGYTNCTFSAILYDGKKMLNGIEAAGVENFSALLRSYYKTEEPQKIRLEFHGAKEDGVKVMLYNKTYTFSDTLVIKEPDVAGQVEQQQPVGLGAAEVMEMVNRKVSELEAARETERMKTEIQTLKDERAALLLKTEELEAKIAAQSTIGAFSELAGKAAPLLTAIFGKSPLMASAADMLSGVGKQGTGATNGAATGDGDGSTVSENKRTIIDLVHEFMMELDDAELADFYSLVAAIEEDRSLIKKLSQTLETLSSLSNPSS